MNTSHVDRLVEARDRARAAEAAARPGVVAADPWLTVDEAAIRVQCNPSLIRHAIKTRRLRAVRLAGGVRYRIRASWVDAWLESFDVGEDV